MSIADGSQADVQGRPPKREPLQGPFGGRAIYLGRVFGIDIGLDYTWLIVFVLVTWSLGARFQITNENWPTGAAWIAGLITSLLFFASILLHELGHSVTSNKLGVPIKSITLFIFGGVARLTREPDRPRDEFLIAVMGPAVSVTLGLIFLGLWQVIPGETLVTDVIRGICFWLGEINLILVVFNCIPGFPLDGGRILRSILWAWTKNFTKATRIAATGGAIFAYVLIIGGLFLLFVAPINGLWMAFIGWFLLNAARSSVTQLVFRDSLSSVRVGETYDPQYERVPGSMSVTQLIDGPILRQGKRTFFVESLDRVNGLVTLQDVKNVAADQRESTPVQAIAHPIDRWHSTSPNDTLSEALAKMDEQGVNQLPVVDGDRVLGVLTRESVLRIVRNFLELGGKS